MLEVYNLGRITSRTCTSFFFCSRSSASSATTASTLALAFPFLVAFRVVIRENEYGEGVEAEEGEGVNSALILSTSPKFFTTTLSRRGQI